MWLELVQTLFYITLSATFSASEVSLFSIPREDIPGLKNGSAGERRVSNLLARGEETLVAILLGNIFVNLMVVGLVGVLVKKLVGDSPVLFFLGSTGILLVLGEIIPKAIALKAGKGVVLFTAPFIILVRTALKPLIIIFSKINRTLLRWNYLFLLSSPSPFVTDEEYVAALEKAAKKGEVSKNLSRFMKEMGDVVDYPLNRIVVHRTQIEEKCKEFRVDLSEDGMVTGLWTSENIPTKLKMNWVSDSRTIGDVMKLFRELSHKIILVHDEYGDFFGIVTDASLYRYLSSLYSAEEEVQGSIELKGSVSVASYINWFDEEILDKYPEIRTVGGLLTACLESIPAKGAVFESKLCIFEVLEAEQNSVGKLRITRK